MPSLHRESADSLIILSVHIVVRGTTVLNSAITDIQQASNQSLNSSERACTSFYRTRGMGVKTKAISQ